jgi:hypothetical protein
MGSSPRAGQADAYPLLYRKTKGFYHLVGYAQGGISVTALNPLGAPRGPWNLEGINCVIVGGESDLFSRQKLVGILEAQILEHVPETRFELNGFSPFCTHLPTPGTLLHAVKYKRCKARARLKARRRRSD